MYSKRVVFVTGILLVCVCVTSEAFSKLTNRLRHFETLHKSSLSHSIVKRGLDPQRLKIIQRLKFLTYSKVPEGGKRDV
jgi:hypothetical protein